MCVCVNKREIENVSEICQTSSRKSHPIFHNKRKYSKHTQTQNCVPKERNIQQRSFFSVQQQWFLPEQQNIIMFSEQHREQARERETVGWEMRKIFLQICYREHKPHTVYSTEEIGELSFFFVGYCDYADGVFSVSLRWLVVGPVTVTDGFPLQRE